MTTHITTAFSTHCNNYPSSINPSIMLSNNLKRASTILSRRAIQGSIKRCLSSAAPAPVSADANVITIALKVKVNEPPAAPRGLPTRHSRHHVPVAAPVDSLDENGQKIIGSIPGTLFGKLACYVYNKRSLCIFAHFVTLCISHLELPCVNTLYYNYAILNVQHTTPRTSTNPKSKNTNKP